MKVSSVNRTNSKTNFKGYVDSKLINLIKTSANDAMKYCAESNGLSWRVLKADDLLEIKEISQKSDEILEILENSGVKKLHPDTYLTYTNIESENDYKLKLVNGKIKKHVDLGNLINGSASNTRGDNFYTKGFSFKINEFQLFNQIAEFFEKAKDKLTPEKLKKHELEMFTSYTDGGIIHSRRHKKANRLAPEFGLPANWTKILAEQRRKEKLQKELDKRLIEKGRQQLFLERKQIEAQNMEILKKYLK